VLALYHPCVLWGACVALSAEKEGACCDEDAARRFLCIFVISKVELLPSCLVDSTNLDRRRARGVRPRRIQTPVAIF
jgi:hypothetical protein